MRHFEDMPTLAFTDMPTLEIIDLSMFETPERPAAENNKKPVYREWGFWLLLAVSVVLSFASGILIRNGGSLFG